MRLLPVRTACHPSVPRGEQGELYSNPSLLQIHIEEESELILVDSEGPGIWELPCDIDIWELGASLKCFRGSSCG